MPSLLSSSTTTHHPLSIKEHPHQIVAEVPLPEGNTLILLIPNRLYDLLCIWRGNSYKAAVWLQARIMEVVRLSPETVSHYLNLMICQQIPLSELARRKSDPSNLPRIEVYQSPDDAPVRLSAY